MKRCQVGLVRESEVGTNIYPDYNIRYNIYVPSCYYG